MVNDHIDMDGLIASLDPCYMPETSAPEIGYTGQKGPTIAVARDKAFCFYYPDNLEILEKFGAKIVEFSPLNDEHLPRGIDGIYLGGGYPEMYAKKLSEKTALLQAIKEKSLSGMPVYGECGGFMFLCKTLSAMDDTTRYPMSGCFEVHMSKRLRSLGYREITLKADTIIGKKGAVLRGHEFHYSSLEKQDITIPRVYRVTSRAGQDICLEGYQVFNTLGSYLHVHFGSNPGCAQQFVETCTRFRNTKNVI